MKRIFHFFLFICICSNLFASETSDHSTICLNMIVKDESKVIRRCLATIKPLIDYWVIVDTGSRDGTQKIIKEFMKDIPGELHERPWINFAHNRNEALSLAKGKADYLFFVDADDAIEISPDFRKTRMDKDGYMINIYYGGMTYARTAFVKSNQPWKWVGVVHEVLVCPEAATSGFMDHVAMRIIGGGDRSHDPKKFLKDAKLLEKALEEEPGHARNQFYLAQSYRDAQEPELSLAHYEKRVAMGGWDQEVFWSLYQIAQLQETLNMPESTVVKSYNRAYLYRPTRLEPLYQLCYYYRRQENYLMGYLVGQLALNTSAKQASKLFAHPLTDSGYYPQQLALYEPKDPLFVESWIYDYALLMEYSICAYWIGKFQESKDICEYLLAKPTLPAGTRECVEKNLQFCRDKLAEKTNIPLLLKGA
jgi:glycosyltransferase involved in cell wall biosynthesis